MRSARRCCGFDPETPEPVALAAALASRAVAFGHSVLPLERVPDLLTEIASDRAPPPLPDIGEWCAALRASPYVGTDGAAGTILVLEGERVALRRYRDYEVRLARALAALTGPVEPAPDPQWLRVVHRATVPAKRRNGPRSPGARGSRRALRRVMLLTGGPGTGKTSTIARVLALAVAAARHARSATCASCSPRRPARRPRVFPNRCAKTMRAFLPRSASTRRCTRRCRRRPARCIACSAGGRARCTSVTIATIRSRPISSSSTKRRWSICR